MNKIIIVLMSAIIVQCSSIEFSREELKKILGKGSPSNEQILQIKKIKSENALPFSLGIYFVPIAGNYFFRIADKNAILKRLEPYKVSGILKEIQFIPSSLIIGDESDKQDLGKIRLAAARFNMDRVLIINSVFQENRNGNFLSLLYLSIIGLWLIPGTQQDLLLLVDSSLWDVNNGFLFYSAQTESIVSQIKPIIFIDTENAFEKAKKEGIENVVSEFSNYLKALKNAKN